MIGSNNPALHQAILAASLDRQIWDATEAGGIFTAQRLRAEHASAIARERARLVGIAQRSAENQPTAPRLKVTLPRLAFLEPECGESDCRSFPTTSFAAQPHTAMKGG